MLYLIVAHGLSQPSLGHIDVVEDVVVVTVLLVVVLVVLGVLGSGGKDMQPVHIHTRKAITTK
jgi:hypothetical protein